MDTLPYTLGTLPEHIVNCSVKLAVGHHKGVLTLRCAPEPTLVRALVVKGYPTILIVMQGL